MKLLRPVAVGLLVAAVLGGCGGRPDIRVEHRTTDSAPEPLADAGPGPGPLQEAWRTTIRTRTGPPGYHLAGGHLIVVSKDAIEAYDARTGKPSWHYREPGRRIDGSTTTDGVIVAGFEKDSDTIEERHTFGLDAGTGELLWENTEDWDLTYDGDGSGSRPLDQADAADGIVPISVDANKGRLGIEARTGDKVWSLTVADVASGECTETKGGPVDDPNASVLPVEFLCEQQDLANGSLDRLLLAVEPDSGDVRWSRRLDSEAGEGSATIQTRGGFTVIEPAGEPAAPELIGPNGRTVFGPANGRCSVYCQLYVGGGRVLLRYAEVTGETEYDTEETEDMLASFDPKSGRIGQMRDPAQFNELYHAAGGRLFGLTQAHGGYGGALIADRLLPAGLATIDVAARKAGGAPMPYPSPGMFPPAEGQPAAAVAVGGERLFTVRQLSDPADLDGPYRGVMRAYTAQRTAGPPELGGVSPDEWPDPCALVAGIPNDPYDPEPPEPGRKVRIGEVTIERASCSRYLSTVRIAWVAPTEEAAAEMLPGGQPSDVGADEQREFNDTLMVYRVGRVILFVETYEDMDAVAEQVIRNLREL